MLSTVGLNRGPLIKQPWTCLTQCWDKEDRRITSNQVGSEEVNDKSSTVTRERRHEKGRMQCCTGSW